MKRVLLSLSLLVMVVPLLAEPFAAAATKPNIIIIQLDDMRDSDWQALPRTMQLLESRNGVWFENYFTPTPVCCPSRSSLLTGRYAHNHGVLRNTGQQGGWRRFRPSESNTMATWLKGAGYRTAMIGKYLNGFPSNGNKPPGWHRFHATTNQNYYNFTMNEDGKRVKYTKKPQKRNHEKKIEKKRQKREQKQEKKKQQKQQKKKDKKRDKKKKKQQQKKKKRKKQRRQSVQSAPQAQSADQGNVSAEKKNKKKKKRKNRKRDRNYVTDVLRAKSTQFIKSTRNSTPIFLQISMRAPHAPFVPAKRHRNLYPEARVPEDEPWFNPSNVDGKPDYIARRPQYGANSITNFNAIERRRLQTLAAADEMIEAIWVVLEQQGRLDNTYIFVISDNGILLGEHRWYGKNVPYDLSVRIPMLVYGPPGTDWGDPDRLVANVDLAPTIREIAGLGAADLDGVSLFENHRRDAILLEMFGAGGEAPAYAGIRTDDNRLYVEYVTGEAELYDYNVDPYEMDNLLVNGEEPPDDLDDLQDRLDDLRDCKGAQCR